MGDRSDVGDPREAALRHLAGVVAGPKPSRATDDRAHPVLPELVAYSFEAPFRSEDGRHPAAIVLERSGDVYRLRERISYQEPTPPRRVFVFPDDLERFRTDLTSVWPVFAWLVPRDGAHTPAVLLHDALIRRPGEAKNHRGDDVSPDEADRLFRLAMGQVGVEPIRRWLMWAAVSLRTLVDRSARPRARFWWWPVIVVTAAASLLLGIGALADLLDANSVLPSLPGMGDAAWTSEAAAWVAAVMLAPLVLLPLWGRWATVGWIVGSALTLLAGPVVFAAAGIGVYLGLSWAVVAARELGNRRRPPDRRRPVPRPRILRARAW